MGAEKSFGQVGAVRYGMYHVLRRSPVGTGAVTASLRCETLSMGDGCYLTG